MNAMLHFRLYTMKAISLADVSGNKVSIGIPLSENDWRCALPLGAKQVAEPEAEYHRAQLAKILVHPFVHPRNRRFRNVDDIVGFQLCLRSGPEYVVQSNP